jgi:uncharacterized protein GlcG (DUF336 family)
MLKIKRLRFKREGVRNIITLDKAKKALDLSEKKARDLGINVSTVIVDEHGSVIATSKMDGAIPISPRFAYAKAYTSASLGFPSHGLEPGAEEGKPYFGINTLFGGEITTMAGGLPVMMNKKLVGGIGVGGSTDTKQDLACAEEAIKALAE